MTVAGLLHGGYEPTPVETVACPLHDCCRTVTRLLRATPGDVSYGEKSVDDLVAWANAQKWDRLGATLLNSGEEGAAEHWSNKLACKDLERRLHERIARDLSHFRGRLGLYEVWKDSLQRREWIDRCGETLSSTVT